MDSLQDPTRILELACVKMKVHDLDERTICNQLDEFYSFCSHPSCDSFLPPLECKVLNPFKPLKLFKLPLVTWPFEFWLSDNMILSSVGFTSDFHNFSPRKPFLVVRRELEDSTPDHSRFEYSPATDL